MLAMPVPLRASDTLAVDCAAKCGTINSVTSPPAGRLRRRRKTM